MRVPAAAALVVLLGALGPAAGASQGPSPAYRELVERYAAGDREGAAADLAGWDAERVEQEALALGALQKTALACPLCPASAEWRRIARAALMLQTDSARLARRVGRPVLAKEAATAQVARLLANDPDERSFVERWFLSMAGLAQGENRWDDARDWAEAGLQAFPASPDLLLARGSIEETVAAQAALPSTEPTLVTNPSQRQANRQRQQDALFGLERARDAYLAAIAAAPGLSEPRLRLGRVQWRLGRPEESRATLEGLLSARKDGSDAFLAHLFLGRVHEDALRLGEALASYESALALHPRAQSALIARSHLRLRRGDVAGARRDAETAVAAGGHRLVEDPYWLYPWGAAVGVEERLEALRREASP